MLSIPLKIRTRFNLPFNHHHHHHHHHHQEHLSRSPSLSLPSPLLLRTNPGFSAIWVPCANYTVLHPHLCLELEMSVKMIKTDKCQCLRRNEVCILNIQLFAHILEEDAAERRHTFALFGPKNVPCEMYELQRG